jgi:hypothetical protein
LFILSPWTCDSFFLGIFSERLSNNSFASLFPHGSIILKDQSLLKCISIRLKVSFQPPFILIDVENFLVCLSCDTSSRMLSISILNHFFSKLICNPILFCDNNASLFDNRKASFCIHCFASLISSNTHCLEIFKRNSSIHGTFVSHLLIDGTMPVT